MSKPDIADIKPIGVEIKEGEDYFWCACGHDHLNQFNPNDITTWKREMADLTGVQFAGVN